MTKDTQQLEQVQRWMQSVITHPDGIAAGIDSPAARQHVDVVVGQIEEVVCRSQALTSIERLEVYGNAYYARLVECMAAEFPATQHAVGEEAFGGFVFDYLQEFPSTSYTLGDLGAAFPGYLASSRPPREGDGPDWADFLVDLAALERVYSNVFDGPGEERISLLSAEQLRSIPPGQWGDLRLQTAASLRLVEFRFPVQEYAAAVRSETEATIPLPQTTRLAINRREYIVRRRALEALPFDLLQRLHAGVSLGDAIAQSVDQVRSPPEELSALLQQWFQTWTAAGYFVGVWTPGDSP